MVAKVAKVAKVEDLTSPPHFHPVFDNGNCQGVTPFTMG